MKKVIFIATLALTLAITSCNTGTGCYWVHITQTVNNETILDQEGFFYGTDEEIIAWADANYPIPAIVSATRKVDYLKVKKSQDDCR